MKISVSRPIVHYVLVDYDNLAKSVGMTVSDCPRIISMVIKAVDQQTDCFKNVNYNARVCIRLYGGWFRDKEKTILAQNLIKEIASRSSYSQYTLNVNARLELQIHLAQCIECMPNSPFFGTLRHYHKLPIKVDDNVDVCCDDMDKLISRMDWYLRNDGQCFGCGKTGTRPFYSEGQKLVDTMMASDLHWFARDETNRVVLVSSDNDLIPPVFQQSLLTRNVYHVLTTEESDFCYENYYYPIRPQQYKQVFFKKGV